MCAWEDGAGKRRLDLESEYWRLLQSGIGTVTACHVLGIGRKTGYRWRAENGGLPPARLAESADADDQCRGSEEIGKDDPLDRLKGDTERLRQRRQAHIGDARPDRGQQHG